MIRSIAATPARPMDAKALAKVAGLIKGESRSKLDGALSLAGGLASPIAAYDGFKAAFGHGTAGTALQIIGGINAGVGVYRGVKSIASHVSSEQVNAALKDANGGKDLDKNDSASLASNINTRAHLDGAVTTGSSLALGAAIVTGSV